MINSENGPVSNAFIEKGLLTFEDSCEWVRALSYKRNSTKNDILIVIKEECGTCSSKHELLKRLAEENGIENCKLILCIYKMSGINTPKVNTVLEKCGLEYIPEAHTYLELNGVVHDFTFSDKPEMLFLKDVMNEEEITADQIREYKADTHKAYLRKWGEVNGIAYSFEELWEIREECIGALST